MKKRYKVLLVIVLLWIGMSYEGSRNATPLSGGYRYDMTLEEQIRLYELGLLDEVDDGRVGDAISMRGIPHSAYEGNWFARSGRRIGDALQTFVREVLRGLVRFFDGIIT